MPYSFPRGTWRRGKYVPAIGEEFTGSQYLELWPQADGQVHYQAILVHCDDQEFIDKLIAALNEISA